MTRRFAPIPVALILAACQPAVAQDRISAGAISMSVPPLLHQVPKAEGFTFAAGGWRLAWAEPDAGPGKTLLAVQGFSGSGDGRLLQGGVRVGESTDPASVGNCLTYGLTAGDPQPMPDQQIDGVTFHVTRNSDAGMSQQLRTTSYRTVLNGNCIAIDRYTYASPRPIPEGAPNPEDIAQALDAAVASIRIQK